MKNFEMTRIKLEMVCKIYALLMKDVIQLENFGVQRWFNVEMTRIIGNGMNTSFWNDKWREDMMFRNKYPRLFSISYQKEAMVGDIGEVVGTLTEWHFDWRRISLIGNINYSKISFKIWKVRDGPMKKIDGGGVWRSRGGSS